MTSTVDPEIKAALREMARLEMDLFSRLDKCTKHNSYVYHTMEYVMNRMEGCRVLLVPANHPLLKQIEKHVYFMPLIEPRIAGHLGNFDGVPVVVNTQPTKATRMMAVYDLTEVGFHILGVL